MLEENLGIKLVSVLIISTWNWLGYIAELTGDDITKQTVQWTSQCHREKDDQRLSRREIWKRDVEKYGRKMETKA